MSAERLLKGAALFLLLAIAVLALTALWLPDLWLTPDQRGDHLMRHQRYEEAATVYRDPFRQGVALYRAAKFDDAAKAFARAPGADALYDRGNAFLMRGKYEAAVTSYEKALALRPGWKEARDNRTLALARYQALHPPTEGEEAPDQKPDEIVVDKVVRPSGEKTEITAGDALSDRELRELWLRRVQTKTADFLKAKFQAQLIQRRQEGK